MRTLLFTTVLLGGCFGEGPVPSQPTGVTILYTVPPPTADSRCSMSLYLGDLAINSDHGYAFHLPYQPWNCNNNSSGPPQIDVPVVQFPTKSAETARQVEIAGRSNFGSQQRVAAAGSNAAWVFIDSSQSKVDVHGVPSLNTAIQTNMGFYGPVAMTGDTTAFYVAGEQNTMTTGGYRDVDDPQYPCCGPLAVPGDITSQVYAVTPAGAVTTLPFAPKFYTQTLKNALVNNTTSLFYTEYQTPISTNWTTLISTALKNGTMAHSLAMVPRSQGVVVGLDASDLFVAWTISISYENPPYPAPLCTIKAYDFSANKEVTLFTTGDFSCMDAAIDATHVYFTIVEVADHDDQRMRGVGLGRVSLQGGNVETLRLGIQGPSAGPRRVYLDGTDQLYAVDPFTVARLPKASLDGKHDF